MRVVVVDVRVGVVVVVEVRVGVVVMEVVVVVVVVVGVVVGVVWVVEAGVRVMDRNGVEERVTCAGVRQISVVAVELVVGAAAVCAVGG